MRTNNIKTHGLIVLLILVCVGLVIGAAFGKYTSEFSNIFDLIISPIIQNETDTTLHRYFRSNELLPASENAVYTINGTSGWFTVANALDKNTVSQDVISYTLTWYVSEDGTTWTEYQKENGSFAKNNYKTAKYTVAPVTIGGTVYNHVKVVGKTSSFLQEDIEAVYSFTYSEYEIEITYANSVITVQIDTNDMSGDYNFSWPAGIIPDNSDPNQIFANAQPGPSKLTATLKSNTAYEFLFFVTDSTLIGEPSDAANVIGITKK